MRFSIISTAVLAINTSVNALTVQDVVDSLDGLTGQVQSLVTPLQTVTGVNPTTIVPQIVSGLGSIATTATNDLGLGSLLNLSPITGAADTSAITHSFVQFVSVFQQVVHVLVQNAAVFTTLPIVGPGVATALATVGGLVDNIANGLTELLQQGDLTGQANALTATIQSAVQTLNIPKKSKRALQFTA